MGQRVQKIIAAHGMASRRKAEELVRQGRVRVNGAVVQLGALAEENDRIEIDGVPLAERQQMRYILLNKPRGYLTALSDDRGRRTVAQLVADCPERVFPVGRLDQYSEGLLLLTNDGALAQRLTHPSAQVDKTYLVWVCGCTEQSLQALSQPIELDGRQISPPNIVPLWRRGDQAELKITIHEGRNRQIRRMCQAAGMQVTRLKRIGEGGILLGKLPVGQWRDLTAAEREQLNLS